MFRSVWQNEYVWQYSMSFECLRKDAMAHGHITVQLSERSGATSTCYNCLRVRKSHAESVVEFSQVGGRMNQATCRKFCSSAWNGILPDKLTAVYLFRKLTVMDRVMSPVNAVLTCDPVPLKSDSTFGRPPQGLPRFLCHSHFLYTSSYVCLIVTRATNRIHLVSLDLLL